MSNYDKINYRQKGKSSDGKLTKGFIQNAHQKLSSGTIPSKYETIIYKNKNVKAFGSSSGRFFNNICEENPAPGQYQASNQSFSTLDTISQSSHPKNGYGNGFMSKTMRTTFTNKYLNSGPGPGFYDNLKDQKLLNARTQNIKGSSCFLNQGQKGLKIEQKQNQDGIFESPGPAQYEFQSDIGKLNTQYNSVFISKTLRQQYLSKNQAPGAGQYNIKRNLIPKKSYTHIGGSRFFKQPSNIDSHQNEMIQLTKFINDKNKKIDIQGKIIQEPKQTMPGPGEYDPILSEFKSEYNRAQSSSNFREGCKDRFGQLKDNIRQQIYPAPGEYRVEDVVGFNTHYSQRAFVNCPFGMSETIREPYGKYQDKMGPNSIIPYKQPNKKSFHLNKITSQWV